MTIYVDDIVDYGRKGPWCHMMTDGPIDELHQMAARIGLKRTWFQDHQQHPHYDLRPSRRVLAIRKGAVPARTIEMLEKCREMLATDAGNAGNDHA